LRESWREGGKVKTRTLANLSRWPDAKVEVLWRVLRGETVVPPPHGHVTAVLGALRRNGLDRLLPRWSKRFAKWILALIVAWVVDLAFKLATARR
jgi:hypothetical protein